jgi:hypothetical protein
VVQLAEGFERCDHLGELRVEAVDLEGVVEQVAADLGGVGPVGRDRDVGEALAGFASGAFFVNAMRPGGAEPKEKRCAGRAIAEERVEIFRVIARVEGGVGPWREEFFVVFSAEGMARESAGRALARAPAFAGEAGAVMGRLEEMGKHGEFLGQAAVAPARLADLPDMPTGQHGAA